MPVFALLFVGACTLTFGEKSASSGEESVCEELPTGSACEGDHVKWCEDGEALWYDCAIDGHVCAVDDAGVAACANAQDTGGDTGRDTGDTDDTGDTGDTDDTDDTDDSGGDTGGWDTGGGSDSGSRSDDAAWAWRRELAILRVELAVFLGL